MGGGRLVRVGSWVLALGASTVLCFGWGLYAQTGATPGVKPLRVPPGFQAKPGTPAETYSNTGWAKEIVHDKTGIEMVFIPAGEFTLGSLPGEASRLVAEGPAHCVRITKAFYMGKCEVTRGQFAAFANDANYRTDAENTGWAYAWDGQKIDKVNGVSWRKAGFAQADDHPVVCVSHNDATAFCAWLSRQTGSAVRLPTEAQWEYACRAKKQTAYPWGDNPDDGKGWCNAADQAAERKSPGHAVVFNWDDGFVFTSPVGNYRANSFGLHEMIGNVSEWCSDWYGWYGDHEAIDPTGPADGVSTGVGHRAERVVRGGCWDSIPWFCRSACRGGVTPSAGSSNIGFRLALDLR